METALSIAIGVGLSAACGFRIFVPLLIMSVASISGYLPLSSGFSWIGTYPALIAFATAAVLEVGAYFIPWLDHALDTIASPAAVVAGTIVTASVVTEMSPFLKWTLALVAGGGIAGIVQGSTVALRAKSTVLTAGLGNPIVALAELIGATGTALLAILLPIVALIVIALLLIYIIRKTGHLVFGRRPVT
jgi:hypothetical protein